MRPADLPINSKLNKLRPEEQTCENIRARVYPRINPRVLTRLQFENTNVAFPTYVIDASCSSTEVAS